MGLAFVERCHAGAEYFRLSELPSRICPPVSLSTVRRWARAGLRRAHGAKLRTILVGGTVVTSAPWVEAFLSQLNAERDAALGVVASDPAPEVVAPDNR